MTTVLFSKDNGQDDLTFYSDGVLSCSCYSYQIDSYGNLELSKEETKNLYEAMKKYYEKG